MEGRKPHVSASELLHRDHYSVEELAEVLDISPRMIEQAAFSGRLKAEIVDHHVISIKRADVIAWLDWRESQR